MPSVSIVIPMHNEAENARPLITEIVAAMASIEAEILAVNDGSTDETAEVLAALADEVSALRVVSHPIAGGQSAAVHSGVLSAKSLIIATLDGDGQNPPNELPRLVAPLLSGPPSLGLVAGQRIGRQDTLSKRLASRAANRFRAWLLQDGTRDTGCGLKAFRRDAFLALPYFDHMHRYLPALFKRDGWDIEHIDVTHKERLAGRSKYTNLGRAVVGIYDLIGVVWLIRRRKRVRQTEPEAGSID